jgi:hypothetical protein
MKHSKRYVPYFRGALTSSMRSTVVSAGVNVGLHENIEESSYDPTPIANYWDLPPTSRLEKGHISGATKIG